MYYIYQKLLYEILFKKFPIQQYSFREGTYSYFFFQNVNRYLENPKTL